MRQIKVLYDWTGNLGESKSFCTYTVRMYVAGKSRFNKITEFSARFAQGL